MELRQLNTFHMVATLLSFHGAANALGYAQSTVSAQIQGLEEDLGARVFERVGRKIHLTPAGERLMGYAKKMIDLEREARAGAVHEDESQGSVNVCASDGFCTAYLSKILKDIYDNYSEMQVHFSPFPAQIQTSVLADGTADLLLFLGDAPQSSKVQVETLAPVPLALVGRRKLQLAGQLLVTNAELAEQTMLMLTSDGTQRASQAALLQHGVTPARVVELGSLASLLRLVAAGQGVAFLPAVLARQEQQAGRLSILEWEGGAPTVGAHMVYPAEHWLSASVKQFMGVVRQVVTG